MNKLTGPALFLGALAVALHLLAPSVPAAAQGRAATKWQYKVFRLDPADYTDKADYRQIYRKHGARKAEAVFLEHVLEHLGKEGWELVSFERRAKNLLYLYLKKPSR